MFEREADGGWVEVTELGASDASSGDSFGDAVALDGDTIAVGARNKVVETGDGNTSNETSAATGAVYVFDEGPGGWQQTAKLTPEDVDSWSEFGTSLGLEGDTLLVGSDHDDLPAADGAGSAFVFRRGLDGSWTQQTRLTSPAPESLDFFGHEVALSGDRAAVGVPRGDGGGNNTGEVHVFERSGGSWQHATLVAPADLESRDRFGDPVEIEDDTLLAGAPGDDEAGFNAGAAYAIGRRAPGVWTREAKLVGPGTDAGEDFGRALAYEGGTALVGHPGDGEDAGSVHVYRHAGTSWDWTQRLRPADIDARAFDSSLFGSSVDLGQGVGIASAPFDDEVGLNSGSAYTLAGPDCALPEPVRDVANACLALGTG